MQFGTILLDPPWSYQKTSRHEKLSGYSDTEYEPLQTKDLAALPIRELGTDKSVLLLWTTFPFVSDALQLIDSWGYTYVTGLPWVKTNAKDQTKVSYGVGYWFRGAAELLLVGKRKASYRTNWTGLISPSLGHSRKPDSVYELAESFPGPRLEVFARRSFPGWYSIGNEAPGDGEDVRITLSDLCDHPEKWENRSG